MFGFITDKFLVKLFWILFWNKIIIQMKYFKLLSEQFQNE